MMSQLPITPFNMVCTNVPGPQYPLYLLGHKMLHWYPYVPVGGEMAVNCAILSYDGTVYFGFSGDVHAVPDLRRLEEFAESKFRANCGTRPGTRPPRKTSGTAQEGAREKRGRRRSRRRAAGDRLRYPVPSRFLPLRSKRQRTPAERMKEESPDAVDRVASGHGVMEDRQGSQERADVMVEGIQSAAQVTSWLVPGQTLFLLIHVLGVACFAYIVAKRWCRSFGLSVIFVLTGH